MAANDAEAVDFEPDEDDLMEEDAAEQVDASPAYTAPKIRSAVTGAGYNDRGGGGPKKTKGRGFREETDAERNRRFASREFESLDTDGGPGPQRSIEGWIVLVTGVHEEAQEEDILNAFGDYGQLKNLHLNLDRRTGFVKGYALIEYEKYDEALSAIQSLNGSPLLGQIISVEWAFCKGSFRQRNLRRRSPRTHRSRSPRRRY